MPRMSITERRQALMEAAFRVIAEKGVAAATTRAIAAEAGMPLASFHYAFESHTDLMGELIEVVATRESEAIDEVFEMRDDLLGSVRMGLQAFISHLVESPGMERAVLEMTMFASRTPTLEHLAPQMYARYRAIAVRMLEKAEAAGYTWSVPREDIAFQIVTITDGLAMTYLVDHDEASVRRAADALARGIASQGRHPDHD